MDLDCKIGLLVSMTRVQKKVEWRRVFGTPAPPAFGIALMTRAIAARYKEQALGGPTNAELRQLDIQSRKDQRHPRGVRAASVKPGT